VALNLNLAVIAWRRRVRRVDSLLEMWYRSPRLGNLKDPTAELFYILLSNRTDPRRYPSVFRHLRKCYTPWTRLLGASLSDLESILQPLGLAKTRALRILEVAGRIFDDFGAVSIGALRRWSLEDARAYLMSLPGVGEKTARCVLMYSFGHDIAPVDTHHLRVFVRLGLLPEETSPKRAHQMMDDWLPRGVARRLHVNLLAHGRAVCTARSPRCGDCPARRNCPSAALSPRT
jgi:endonuclease III